MKKLFFSLFLALGLSAQAAEIGLPQPVAINLTVSAIEVDNVSYDQEGNWTIAAHLVFPSLDSGAPLQSGDTMVTLAASSAIHVRVTRADIEAFYSVEDVLALSVNQLNTAVNTIALQKALAKLAEVLP